MRKIYFLTVLFFSSFLANAQIKKNSTLVGADAFLYHSTIDSDNLPAEQRATSTNIGVSVGKAFRDNNIVGISVRYAPISEKNYSDGGNLYDRESNEFGIGFFYRGYKVLAKDFYFYANTELGFSASKSTRDYQNPLPDDIVKSHEIALGLTPGLSYRIFRKMHLELMLPNLISIRYSKDRNYNDDPITNETKRTTFSFASSLNTNAQAGLLGVGFRLVL